MFADHRALDGLSESRIVDEEPKLDVLVLGAEREVGARQEKDFVINYDELRVADDRLAVGQHGGLVDSRVWKLRLDFGGVGLVAVDVYGDNDSGLP